MRYAFFLKGVKNLTEHHILNGGQYDLYYGNGRIHSLSVPIHTITTRIPTADSDFVIETRKMKKKKVIYRAYADIRRTHIVSIRTEGDCLQYHAQPSKVCPTITTLEQFKWVVMPERLTHNRRMLDWVGGHKDVPKTWHYVDVANTVTCHRQSCNHIVEENIDKEAYSLDIRKLTERECLRFMDVDDKDIDKICAAVPSRSARYVLAGNSIVVNVLYHIFRKIFIDTEPEKGEQLNLFDNI